MTKLLDKAIARTRQLPPEDQDVVAVAMLAMVDASPIVELDEETREAIREGLAACAERSRHDPPIHRRAQSSRR
jgi:hypothetical protein